MNTPGDAHLPWTPPGRPTRNQPTGGDGHGNEAEQPTNREPEMEAMLTIVISAVIVIAAVAA